MSALTNELIDIRASITNIEDNVCEISVKCKTHQDNFAKSITDCKKEHSSQYKIGMFNKNFAPWERAGRSILWIALLGMMAASFFFNKEDRTKQNKQLQDSIRKTC